MVRPVPYAWKCIILSFSAPEVPGNATHQMPNGQINGITNDRATSSSVSTITLRRTSTRVRTLGRSAVPSRSAATWAARFEKNRPQRLHTATLGGFLVSHATLRVNIVAVRSDHISAFLRFGAGRGSRNRQNLLIGTILV